MNGISQIVLFLLLLSLVCLSLTVYARLSSISSSLLNGELSSSSNAERQESGGEERQEGENDAAPSSLVASSAMMLQYKAPDVSE